MESAMLHCHSGTVQFLLAPSRGSCPRLSFYIKEMIGPVLDSAKGNNFAYYKPPVLPVTASHRRIHGQFLWQCFTATAVRGDVSIEEPISETRLENKISEKIKVLKEDTDKSKSGEASKELRSSSNSPRQRKRFSVSVDCLTPGATFKGKVTNIEKYGAFVDIGAFTSGLIHISQMSKSFVENVEDVVQVGQVVRVQILSVHLQSKRISLILKNEDKEQEEVQEIQPQEMSKRSSRELSVTQRGSEQGLKVSATKPQKGDSLNGVIKNIIKWGVFVTLSHGYEGFLPASEVNSSGAVVPESYFKLGQHITVRVLRTERDRIRLTMKERKDLKKLVEDYNKVDGSVRATNPFEIAFRQNNIVARYLEEKKRLEDAAEGKLLDDGLVTLPLSEDL